MIAEIPALDIADYGPDSQQAFQRPQGDDGFPSGIAARREQAHPQREAHPRAIMIRGYIGAAMRCANYEILSDDGTYYGEIHGFKGV